jgi:hypothetical protein
MNCLTKPGALVLAAAFVLAGGASATEKDDGGDDKPAIDLRMSPRMGFSPLSVLFTLEFKGGDEHEDYYCPEIEWEWGDGSISTHESDCDPFVPGESKIDRRYIERHLYQYSGTYPMKVRIKRVDRLIATASIRVSIRPGPGDQNRRDYPD